MRAFDNSNQEDAMTEQEIKAIEKARAWIFHDVMYGDSPAIQNKAQDITDVLDEIIQKYRQAVVQ